MEAKLEDPMSAQSTPGPERFLQKAIDDLGILGGEVRTRWDEFEETAQKNEGSDDLRVLGTLSVPQSGAEQPTVLAETARGTASVISSPAEALSAVAGGLGGNLGFLQFVLAHEISKEFMGMGSKEKDAAENEERNAFAGIDSGEEDKEKQARRYLDQGSIVMQVCARATEDERVRERALWLEDLSKKGMDDVESYMRAHGLEWNREVLDTISQER